MKKKVAEQSEQMIYRQVKHTCTHEDSFLPPFLAHCLRACLRLYVSYAQRFLPSLMDMFFRSELVNTSSTICICLQCLCSCPCLCLGQRIKVQQKVKEKLESLEKEEAVSIVVSVNDLSLQLSLMRFSG
jgi:hypothetical protein